MTYVKSWVELADLGAVLAQGIGKASGEGGISLKGGELGQHPVAFLYLPGSSSLHPGI